MQQPLQDPNEGEPREVIARRSCTMAGVPTPVVFSWSAGKDSAFGLWTLRRDPGFEVRALLTTLTEGYDRVKHVGRPRRVAGPPGPGHRAPGDQGVDPPAVPERAVREPDVLDVRQSQVPGHRPRGVRRPVLRGRPGLPRGPAGPGRQAGGLPHLGPGHRGAGAGDDRERLPGHRGLRGSPGPGSRVRRARIRRTLPG